MSKISQYFSPFLSIFCFAFLLVVACIEKKNEPLPPAQEEYLMEEQSEPNEISPILDFYQYDWDAGTENAEICCSDELICISK